MATGRLSSSAVNDVAKSGGETAVFKKAGTATVAALPDVYTNPHNVALRVAKITVTAGTAPVTGTLSVDVKVDGVSVFAVAGDRAAVATTKKYGVGIPTKSLEFLLVRPGASVTAEITAIGSGTAGSDVTVTVYFA